ncbi:MAG: serine hydroxymethyltransferase [bacterium]|nr:serine hydroxymethyltransferase [bacterium]MCY3580755.1 serine hydroxymethyltransferase [bacterium]MCY3652013.1 serine hydroxymethyltransferase [bacterium]
MRPIEEVDSEVAGLIRGDLTRQNTHIHLIASENFASPAVMEACGSIFTNKYAEGYPGRRYYEGCEWVDRLEQLAIDRAKALFDGEYVNVQPHSGAQANMGVYFAFLEPGDKVLGLSLAEGGHLTHGSPVNFSGRFYRFIPYGVDRASERIDMNEVRSKALEHRPKIVLAGYSAYSRHLDYQAFRSIADEIGALFMVDAAHFIGLVAGKASPNPVPLADIVTATTHKALRGPRGGMIIAKEGYGKELNKGVFPDMQGGPIISQIAGKAVCYQEASTAGFRSYAAQIVANASAMAAAFTERGVRVVSGGTDNHLLLLDMRSIDPDLTGKEAATLLDSMGITLNRNGIPYDPRPPYITSGLRIGTPGITTCGMKEAQAVQVADLITRSLRHRADDETLKRLSGEISDLAQAFPPYPPDFPGHA